MRAAAPGGGALAGEGGRVSRASGRPRRARGVGDALRRGARAQRAARRGYAEGGAHSARRCGTQARRLRPWGDDTAATGAQASSSACCFSRRLGLSWRVAHSGAVVTFSIRAAACKNAPGDAVGGQRPDCVHGVEQTAGGSGTGCALRGPKAQRLFSNPFCSSGNTPRAGILPRKTKDKLHSAQQLLVVV